MENLNKKQFLKWIKALRSGKYKQGKGNLQSADGSYCCLGVACRVLIPKSKLKLDIDNILLGHLPGNQKNRPDWLDIISDDFEYKAKGWLPFMNDRDGRDGFTFDEIADCLELVYIHKMVS